MLLHIYLTNRTHEQIKRHLITKVVKKAKNSLKSLVIAPEIVLSKAAISILLQLTSPIGDNLRVEGVSKLANLSLLECLKIPRSRHKTDDGMINLFSKLNNLKTVDISHWVTNKSVTALANNNPNLRFIVLDECNYVTDASIIKIAEKCSHLERISMNSCWQISDHALVKLAERCPKLQHVSLVDCYNITKTGIEMLLSSAENLKFLDIRDVLYLDQDEDDDSNFLCQIKTQYSNVEIWCPLPIL